MILKFDNPTSFFFSFYNTLETKKTNTHKLSHNFI
ncbi:hypothetical protein LCGC14_2229590, partial [marine sediment metagenome]